MAIRFRMHAEDSLNRGKLEERGIYRVKLETVKAAESKQGNHMASWMARVIRGDQEGAAVYGQVMVCNSNGEPYKWSARKWQDLFAALGHDREYTTDALKAGFSDDPADGLPSLQQWAEEHLVGCDGWLEFTPAIGEGSFSETEWLASSTAQSRMAIVAEAAAARAEIPDDEIPF